jgi:GWxTD domain-containing protein
MRHRFPARLALGLALVASTLPATARSAEVPPLRAAQPPLFTADIAISIDAEGHPALSVSVTLPYPELQWVRLAHGYGAGAEIMVSLDPESGKRRVYGDVWERTLVVPAFEQTVAASAVVDSKTFQVPPGHYRARISVRDLNAGLSSSASQRLEVPDYSRIPFGLSDLELGTQDSTSRFTPVRTRVFGLEVRRLAARVALFDRREGPWPRSYPLHFRILDEQGLEILAGDRQATLGHSAEPVVVRPPQTDLFLGSYSFELDLLEGRSHWRVTRSFEVEESGAPRGKDFVRMLEVLSYIAEPREIERLRSLKPEQQAQGWDEFWRRRDPAAGTGPNGALIEFFRRVHYAEHHFQGFGPGWRSDMGRIYIKYGPPEQIESRSEANGTATVEVWTYSRPLRRFIFEDQEGFGRFVLVSPAFE